MKKKSKQQLINNLAYLAKSMQENARKLRDGKGYSRPDLQNERNALAHTMEFWALKIKEEIE